MITNSQTFTVPLLKMKNIFSFFQLRRQHICWMNIFSPVQENFTWKVTWKIKLWHSSGIFVRWGEIGYHLGIRVSRLVESADLGPKLTRRVGTVDTIEWEISLYVGRSHWYVRLPLISLLIYRHAQSVARTKRKWREIWGLDGCNYWLPTRLLLR